MGISPNQWNRIKELFEASVELKPEQRSTFLRENEPDQVVIDEVHRLLSENEDLRDFLSTPPIQDFSSPQKERLRRFAPGDVLAERFRILHFIASGGMGDVYEAEDLVLKENLAIKTVRSDLVRQNNLLARFKREVQLARKVTHPNVCRVFDLFWHKTSETESDESVVFVSMELLKGETLSDRIRRSGGMSPTEALPLIAQIASGLDAAHRVGIVHRDFKPGNVILVPDAGPEKIRGVITDFGLAFRTGTDASQTADLTGSQGIFGTPAYMTPEQIEGKEVTKLADIYALGLVIYEMVTGNRPFQGDTPMSAALKRLSTTPTPPRKFNPSLSATWESAILQCLEHDPAARPSSAQAVARALWGDGSAPIGTRTFRVRFGRRTRILVFGLLVVAVAFLYIRRQGPRTGVAKVHPRRSVAVLGFKNLSRLADKAWVSTALSYQLTTALAAGEQVRTVPGETLDQMKASLRIEEADGYGKDTLARIRQVVDADEVVLGSYLALGKDRGGRVHLDLKLQNTSDGETIAAIAEDGTEDQLPELVSRSRDALMLKLGVSGVNLAQTEAWNASASRNPDANRWYAEGLEKLRVYDALSAVDLLNKAIAADPSYAPAYSALAQAWIQVGNEVNSLDAAKKAFDLSAPLSREQRLDIEARYYTASHQWDKAADVYHTLAEFFPDNVEYSLAFASAQVNGGKPSIALEALQAFRNSSPADGNNPRIDLVEAKALENLGELVSAQTATTRALNTARSQGSRLIQARAEFQLCFVLSNLGSFPPARAACEDAEQIYAATADRGGLAKAFLNTGNLLADQGAYTESKAKYENAILIYRQIGNKADLAWALNNLGTVIIELHDYKGAKNVHEEALALFQETRQKRGQAASYNNLAGVEEVVGSLEDAALNYEQALAIHRELGDKRRIALVLRNLAELNYERGRLKEAREGADSAQELGRAQGSKKIVADALTTLGAVASAESRIPDAQASWQAAEALFKELALQERLALCAMELARIALEQGDLRQARELAQKAVDAYHSEKDNEREVLPHLLLSEISLAGGDLSGAQKQLTQARALFTKDSSRGTRWALQVGAARLNSSSAAVQKAIGSLKSALSEMHRQGYLTDWMDTRLVLLQMEAKSGKPTAQEDLARLEKEARAKGFLLVANKAAEAVNNHRGQQLHVN